MSHERGSNVKITPILDNEGNNVRIDVDYTMLSKPEDGILTCYIPDFDIYFSADDEAEADKLGVVMIRTFMHYWIKQEGFSMFVRQLKVLGFQPAADIWTNVLKKKKYYQSSFNSPSHNVPNEFEGAERVDSKYAMAY